MPRIGALAALLILNLGTASLAQAPPGRAEPRSYSIGRASAMPLPVRSASLVRMDEVQRDLKLTETQKQRHTALMEQQQAKVQRAREEYEDSEIFQAARNSILDDLESATQDALEPGQRERLEQIRLQVQGPLAFEQRAIRRRLDLSNDQTDEIEAIVEEGMKELRNTSSVVVVLDPGDNPQTLEAIRELVGGLEFQLAKERAQHQVLAGRAALMLRIAKVLTVPQRAAYRNMLGLRGMPDLEASASSIMETDGRMTGKY